MGETPNPPAQPAEPVPARIVLDSSVVIAAERPGEAAHADAVAFLDRLRAALREGTARAFAPPELWLEVYVVERRLCRSGEDVAAGPLTDLAVELVAPAEAGAIVGFLDRLSARTKGKRAFANATDLVYLWAAVETGAVLVTLDQGLLKYDRAVCEVRRPQEAWFAGGR